MANELTEKMVIRIKELEKRLSALERAEYAAGGVSLPWHPLTPPPALDTLTWVNKKTATASRVRDYISFVRPMGKSANLSALVCAAPTPPYKLTAALTGMVTDSANSFYSHSGIGWRDSSSGKLIIAGPSLESWDNYSICPSATSWNSPSSLQTTLGSWSNVATLPLLTWVQLKDDGTKIHIYFGLDAEALSLVYSAPRTSILTPNQLFFGGSYWYTYGTSDPKLFLNLYSWLVEPL